MQILYKNRNWKEIQDFYDTGVTWEEVYSKFKINASYIARAVKENLLISRAEKTAVQILIKEFSDQITIKREAQKEAILKQITLLGDLTGDLTGDYSLTKSQFNIA